MKVSWRAVERSVQGVAAAATLLLGWILLAPSTAPLTGDGELLTVTALTKSALLLTAAVFATLTASGFGKKSPTFSGWTLFAIALWGYAAGQLSLAYYQLVERIATPFPSLADLFFVPGTALLIVALIVLLRAYLASDLFGLRFADLAPVLAGSLVLAAVAGWLLLGPIDASSGITLTWVLGAFYPISDIVLLVPTVLLLRLAWRLRGGRVWAVWGSLAAGFLLFMFGDVCFVFMDAGHEELGPAVDWLYIASYAAVARAAVVQFGLVSQEAITA